ncbi:hypothetical protein KA005_78900 [bacterium]|nr:hypothetical protein [bacterium]
MAKDKNASAPKTEMMTKLKLDVSERLAVQVIFPKEGSMLQQRIKKRIFEKFDLTDEETKTLNPKNNPSGPGVTWTQEAADKIGLKAIKLNDLEMKELEKYAKELDDTGKVPDSAYSLCEKIQEVKKPEKEEEKEDE